MTGLRQAALVLHGLADTDRAWMLGQLPSHQAAPVHELLIELRDLGIPTDPSFAAQALASHRKRAFRASPRGQEPDSTQFVRATSVESLRRVLDGEPQGLIAVLLAAADWPWRDAYLATQEPARMRALVELSRGKPGGARLQSQVVVAVAKRLRASGGNAPSAAASGSSVLRRLRELVIPRLGRDRI